ncbi:type I restriction enzyme HsdR N-terminal domain-containing protein (plasmid) [Halolamina sp. CBA1230]|uniref:type I restriction enzyme HsdR N-terminal domain-containing protein n=1 Tax=Halolamina sp. CBA1230 TaxID=1853690 RepID=UPI0009A22064|nr:type I restriction enzyme HsdR N-terminal domain-containing protein [Halolamina sp. CBA1230]QKY21843.1 type I restriction enzyme HsdR N-terminal domain-containing protein [Halolamina sp. CBA1230]
MVLREELTEYSERSARLIADSPQMDEENTKRKIIEPLIDLLGWDILSMDVELEYSVQMGSGTKKVDYALKIEDTPVVFIEAKGADTELTSGHEDQLRSYMRQVGVDWGLLSNGREFKIFRRDYDSNRPNEISLAEFSLDEIAGKQQPLTALSRNSLESGESRQIAEKIESVQRAVRTLREEKEGLSEDVTRVVTDEIGEAVLQKVEDEAKNFVDNLISSLEEQAHETAVERKATPSPSETESGYEIRITKGGSEIERVVGETQAEAMAELVDYLIENEGLLEVIEIPYVPGTGRGSRALVNEKPVHIDGDEMRQYQRLSQEYYLFTSLSAKDKKRYALELPEKVGLECEFVNW